MRTLKRRIELWWEPTRAPLKSKNKSGAASVAPDLIRSCRLVFRSMRKTQHAEAELYQTLFTHRFCGRAKISGSFSLRVGLTSTHRRPISGLTQFLLDFVHELVHDASAVCFRIDDASLQSAADSVDLCQSVLGGFLLRANDFRKPCDACRKTSSNYSSCDAVAR